MSHLTTLLDTLRSKPQKIHQVIQSLDGHFALTLNTLQAHRPDVYCIILTDCDAAQKLAAELRWYAQDRYPVHHWPSWETLPYERFSPHQDLISERLEILYALNQSNHCTLVTTHDAWMQQVPPPSFVRAHCLLCCEGDTMAADKLRQHLIQAGYQSVNQVKTPGEFAIRGSLIDLFPMGAPKPFRIDCFDDTITDIRSFDPDTQRSIAPLQHIRILPAKEFPCDPDAIDAFKSRWETTFPGHEDALAYQVMNEAQSLAGIEQYSPLFFDEMVSLLTHLPKSTTLLYPSNLHAACETHWQLLCERHAQHEGDRHWPVLPPSAMYLTAAQCFQALKAHHQIILTCKNADANLPSQPLPDLRIHTKAKAPLKALTNWCANCPTLLMFQNEGRAQAFTQLCESEQVAYKMFQGWADFQQSEVHLGICLGPCNNGWQSEGRCMVPESALLGSTWAPKALSKKTEAPPGNMPVPVLALSQLNIGDPIVHADHGVGRYQGLCVKQWGEHRSECVAIAYANAHMLYTPVQQIHLIHAYSTIPTEHAPLHQLGGKNWQKQKSKATSKLHDTAAELLATQAKRALCRTAAMRLDASDCAAFDEGFPYPLTEDQEKALADIKRDLQQPQAMHRLVCGDVGFGKTELAMRAAFIVVNQPCQVAVLAPTTVLAEQHYQNFIDRFAKWPINIACLSRFKTPKAQQAIKDDLAQGKIDIVIGTHSLLHPSIQYKQLGLLIIDEEHRFGVRQKNQIKSHQSRTHLLMLSATPIPRTLHHAFSELTDLSIIATPPKKRKAIKTFAGPYEGPMIQDAIRREMMRGGQVYFLYNQVESMPRMRDRLQKLVPNASIQMAHGQMPKHQLEHVMMAFYQQRCQVLLCSTIIESGIDVPNANTIIIHQADQLGLAQLHQLRGRVGRSHHQAFAYLLYTGDKAITPDAAKRLQAITQHESLGAGFMLASHDLEIRGAGELLGESQSGHLDALGTSFYHELLEQTVTAMRENPELDESIPPQSCDVESDFNALIPDTYMPDIHSRLIFYKRVAIAKNKAAILTIQEELQDRFGVMPAEVQQYFGLCLLRHQGSSLHIAQIKFITDRTILRFTPQSRLDFGQIIELVQHDPKHHALQGEDKLVIHSSASLKPMQKIDRIQSWLDKYQRKL